MCARNCCAPSELKALYRLSNSFPYLLNRVGVRMGELFSRRIESYGVTLPMYRVLAALWESGDQRLSDLATVTTAEISTLSRLIGEMKRKGLVTRSRLEDNGRTVAINLTAKGRTLVEELIPIAVHFEEVAVADYAESEISRLKVVFREIYESLGSIEPEIEAAKDAAKSKRKISPPRSRPKLRASE
jgi:MarR family transcriptional regulator, organic hydroperoxide resistance regulator